MRAKIVKWGNSLVLRLPKNIAADAHLYEGAAVDLRVEGDALVITPSRPKIELSDLLSQLKPEHRHEKVDWEAPKGVEEW